MTVVGYRAARSGTTVYIQVVGLANMKNTPVLDAFLRNEIDDGVEVVCIDLAECGGMDSTFMGTLVGYHKRLEEVGGPGHRGRLVIVNPGSGNRRLLDMLGLSAVLPVVDERAMAADVRYVDLDTDQAASPYARAAMIRDAHEHLVRLNEANKGKFGTFLAALESDLKRMGGAD